MNLFSLERRQADSLQENHLVRLKYQSVSWNEKSQYCLNRNSYKRRKFSHYTIYPQELKSQLNSSTDKGRYLPTVS